MEFDILGPLRVSSADVALELGAPAQRALLAVLLTSPNLPVSDDRLADELWGDEPPPSAHHLVQVYVSRLCAVLDEAPDGQRVVRDGGGHALRVKPDELDAERFLAAVAQGRKLRDRDPEAADRILAGAMRLWRGTPFADFPEPPPAVREHAGYLQRQRLEALVSWFEVRLQLGRHHELVPELTELVVQHPYDEALHAQLVLALYRCGRQAEALQTARALQVRLCEDLGLDASPEVRGLYRDLLLQAPRLSLEPPEPPGNLPTWLTSFVGRRRELQEVAELLEASRLVTLTGLGDRVDPSRPRGGPAGAVAVPAEGLWSWLGERSAERALGSAVRPDGFGRYLLPGGEVIFYLELDRGTEPGRRVGDKLVGACHPQT